ncbi:MAG: nicotinate phosphoribosyltransferase [Armatimonadota bacterium]
MGTMDLYRHPLGLLTDLYELTMAYGYWKVGVLEKEASFALYFRSNPFHGGYAVACGLSYVVDYLQSLHFTPEDLDYLAGLKGNDGKPLLEAAFLDYLGTLEFTYDIDAIPEGTVVFANEPLVRVTGPILQSQILESALLNMVSFQTLIATKGARVCWAARGDPVIEFGMRRAQGIDGAVAASRAAYVGGCDSTSNVLAGKLFDIPVKGTHAHSWVMSFDSELESFEAYARAMPNNCIFLVDTYNTLDGVRHAVQVGKELEKQSHRMVGIRLDSGDLAYLSIEARKILDEGGFPNAVIVASSELDEYIVDSLKEQGAEINVWGVGTKLATAYDQPALGTAYKLTAIRKTDGKWEHKIKLTDSAVKINTPGILQVRRFYTPERFVADMIYDEILGAEPSCTIVDPTDPTRRKQISPEMMYEDLLVPIYRNGQLVYDVPAVDQARQRTRHQLAMLHPTIKRLVNPHEYPAGLEERLYELKTELILK